MRGDLRASIESAMSNQAFALSPISARASLPSEEDYEAIREAFMETARGRWFLDEYARRNRNADTSMVLDAVARIEETLAQQRQAPPPPEDKAAAMLAAIGSAVGDAEQSVSAALDKLGLEESLAPIRKGARIIKEISWRWREIGADGRICDLLDSQVGAIESGCERVAATDPRLALREAFDSIRASISAFSDIAGVVPAPAAAETIVEAATPSEVVPDVMAALDEPVAMAGRVEAPPDEAEPYDEAMLERVAMEMAAPDADDIDDTVIASPPQDNVAEPQMHIEPPAELIEPEPLEASIFASVPEPAMQAAPVAPETAPSLGATILATGLVRRPKTPANDPLAPIRRMTQAEKIAFFS
jgi:hypothetical protein